MSKGRLYAATTLVSAASLMLEVLLTRITSVVAWYHMSFFVISLAMLGMTAGAMYVVARSAEFTADSAEQRMWGGCWRFALSAPIVVAIALGLPIVERYRTTPFSALLLYGCLLAIPFFFSGMTLTIALTRAGLHPSIVYGFDLLGAAAGCGMVIPLLYVVDAPSAVLVASAVGALAGAVYAWPRVARRGVALGLALVLIGLGILNSRAALPLLRPRWCKGEAEDASRFIWVGWNSFSRVTVEPSQLVSPSPWSLSPAAPSAVTSAIVQRRILIDGEAATWMAKDSHRLQEHGWADWDLCSLVHRIRSDGSSVIIGSGGGRDVIAAVRAGHRPVIGVELNPLIARLHTHTMRDFSRLGDLPGVELVAGEARSYLTEDRRIHSTIVMSLIDTWASQGSGAFSLAENGLYSVEAWDLFLSRLKPAGYFSVSRWYYRPSPHETARMLALACETLFRRGARRPADHIALIGLKRLATILVSPSPISKRDIDKLRKEAKRLEAFVLALPGQDSSHPLLRAILSQPDSASLWRLTESLELDLTPPTDDRPFFFNVLRPSTWLKHRTSIDRLDLSFLGNHEATQTLLYALAVSCVLTVFLIGLPLLRIRSGLGPWPRRDLAAASAYFALIGLGFMFVEIGLLSRLNVFLGNPTLGLAVLLGGLICFAGIGSLLSQRINIDEGPLTSFYPLIPAVLTALAALAVVPLHRAFSGSPLGTRILVASLLVSAPAMGMGICFPLGLRFVSSLRTRYEGAADLGPWLWGLNGAFGVCASAMALTCSMIYGIQTTFAVGSACYVLLLVCTARLAGSLAEDVSNDG